MTAPVLGSSTSMVAGDDDATQRPPIICFVVGGAEPADILGVDE